MTTTDYSRELCEICGIEYEKEIENELYRKLSNEGNPCCSQISSKRKGMLKFEQPENFVKLLGLNVSARYRSLMHYITSIFCNTCSVEDFLERLCLELHHNSESDIVKDIKQAIREQEWSYE